MLPEGGLLSNLKKKKGCGISKNRKGTLDILCLDISQSVQRLCQDIASDARSEVCVFNSHQGKAAGTRQYSD